MVSHRGLGREPMVTGLGVGTAGTVGTEPMEPMVMHHGMD